MAKSGIHPLFYDLCRFDNVIGLGHGNKVVRGIATDQQALIVLVRHKVSKRNLSRSALIPEQLDDMPTDVIEVGDICLHGDEYKQKMRPAQPGISIGHYKVSAGTFGAVVYDRVSNERLILSNNHVLANLSDGKDGRAAIGDQILQPGSFDGGNHSDNTIAILKRFVPIYRDTSLSQCQFANLFENIMNKIIKTFKPQYHVSVMRNNEQVNFVDCAVAAPIDPALITPEILGIGCVVGSTDAEVGMAVKKSGRSSGLTKSIVLATEVSLKIDITSSHTAVFGNQILVGPMSEPGDSGSLVVTEDGNAVGLLFAGSEQATLLNPIEQVLNALQVDLLPE